MTAIERKRVPWLAFALGALGLMVVAQLAGATHPRPKGATPVRVSLVPAYKQCISANRTHGGPLASPACSPPVQSSDYLTVGTRDADGAAANSVGSVLIRVHAASPEDVLHTGTISDVRCQPATNASVCSSANADGGPDYSGDLMGSFTARVTDHFNGPIGGSPPGGTDPATVQDSPGNNFIWHCVNTSDTSRGGLCTVDTTRPLIPVPYWFEGKRVNVEITQIQVSDGGADGDVFTKDNTLFAVQGVFVP
jgi:hypothetical protein